MDLASSGHRMDPDLEGAGSFQGIHARECFAHGLTQRQTSRASCEVNLHKLRSCDLSASSVPSGTLAPGPTLKLSIFAFHSPARNECSSGWRLVSRSLIPASTPSALLTEREIQRLPAIPPDAAPGCPRRPSSCSRTARRTSAAPISMRRRSGR